MWQIFGDFDPGLMTELTSLLRAGGTNSPPFRRPGVRAHRNWKKRRAAGRAK